MGVNSYRMVNAFKVCEYFGQSVLKCSKNGTQECSRICVYIPKD